MVATREARLGRPAASNSAETRASILTFARHAFADLGYGVTTNKFIATKVGITSGALYHYFDSKLAIYQAVYEEVQTVVYDRFFEAMASSDSFVGQFEAVLEAAHDLNREDPTLARFVATVRIDASRYDDLRAAIATASAMTPNLAKRLVATGIETGEIDPSHEAQFSALVRVVLAGLADSVSHDIRVHRAAIDGVMLVLAGKVPRPVT